MQKRLGTRINLLAERSNRWRKEQLLRQEAAAKKAAQVVEPTGRMIEGIRKGDIDAVKRALEEKVPANVEDEEMMPVAMIAIEKHYNAIAKLLLSQEAEHDLGLMMTTAICYKNKEMVYFLIEHGADLNNQTFPALNDALKIGDYKLAKFLISKGAKGKIPGLRITPPFFALAMGATDAGINNSLRKDYTIDQKITDACDIIEILVKEGLDVNEQDYLGGRTALAVLLKGIEKDNFELIDKIWHALKSHGAEFVDPHNLIQDPSKEFENKMAACRNEAGKKQQ
ncbi:MAG: ankyrin repeat domain-containing protein [Candidatus Micrarchaeota archaeon]